MSKKLTKNQINFFHENGFLSPVQIMTEEKARMYRSILETYEKNNHRYN